MCEALQASTKSEQSALLNLCSAVWSIELDNMRSLVRYVRLLASDNCLDLLQLAENGLVDRFMLMDMHRVLINEQVEVELRMTEARRLGGRRISAEWIQKPLV